ncbi:putative prolyl 4-hydroxylase 12 [Zea mays]|uniref:procollagen-proline 4-dioxygenase n=2 Tax=Zea mays TaxID=4577 RepID=A0A1D6GFB9_MAIZE|nr:putative prolyl 4-hydroxylase 12 [Zea mays]AQK62268.1 putative prolyl 4-hydroxylase 12 [Zea mays]
MAPPLALLLLAAIVLSRAVSHAHGGGGGFYDPASVTQLSSRPRAFLYSGFLSDTECDHLVSLVGWVGVGFANRPFCSAAARVVAMIRGALTYGAVSILLSVGFQAKGSMEKSMVADNDSGKSVASQARTSSGTFLAKRELLMWGTDIYLFMLSPPQPKDEIVSAIEKRVAAWTFLPEENAESLQVLRYETGQKYDAHFDYFHDRNNLKLGGQRVATVLMYLTDVNKGGETVFPNAEGSHLQYKDETWSECSRSGLAVKPKKGDALLFFNLHVNATADTGSLHGSCPVIEGEKWSATKWIHVRSFDNPPDVRTDAPCSDDKELCPRWAAIGECHRNPTYMVGTKDTLGFCRKSCGICDA